MNIAEFNLGVPMENLFDEVKHMLCDKNLKINVLNERNEEMVHLGGGANAKMSPNGNWEINIVKDEPFIEYVLSHELLHVLLDSKGFPNVYMPSSDICCQFSWKIGNLITNVVLHKIIIDEQYNRGINIFDEPRKKLMDVADTWQIIPELSHQTLEHVLALTSFMIEAKVCLSEYESQIENINPLLYQPAKDLYDTINEKELSTPYKARRILVRILKKLDELLVAKRKEPLRLYEKLLIKFIPRKRQLGLKVSQVFIRNTNEKADILLTTQAEGQLSFYFERGRNDSLNDELHNMTVGSLLSREYKEFIICD